ncbi:MAG TPA: nuclear transport factor 2 family protein [Edaphobacter sp.]
MQIVEHLRQLEEQLLQPTIRKNRNLLTTLIADDFLEIGSSGRTFDKASIVEALRNEPPHPAAILSDFSARPLAEDIYLVTYRTTRCNPSGEPIAAAWRSSIWRNRYEQWQIIFHQGTPTPFPKQP